MTHTHTHTHIHTPVIYISKKMGVVCLNLSDFKEYLSQWRHADRKAEVRNIVFILNPFCFVPLIYQEVTLEAEVE